MPASIDSNVAQATVAKMAKVPATVAVIAAALMRNRATDYFVILFQRKTIHIAQLTLTVFL